MSIPLIARWWRGLDRPAWRNFAVAIAALGVAMGLALYSSAAALSGRLWVAEFAAFAALGLAAWVAITIVPALARRTALRWLAYQIDYRLTHEGLIYLGIVFVLILAALNTGNNLLFLILACLLGAIVVSGVLSRIVLSDVELKIELPATVFAARPVVAILELANRKRGLPSFSLVLAPLRAPRTSERHAKQDDGAQILTRPVYFAYIPGRSTARQKAELTFSRRGLYRQDSFALSTRFPFGFLEKSRRVNCGTEVLVYPRVEPAEQFYTILPLLTGERTSFYRGRGHDLYSIRDYQPSDSARFVDWKASAKTGRLKVREFTREDERRIALVFDPLVPCPGSRSTVSGKNVMGAALATDDEQKREQFEEDFERAVSLCACLAWHFYETNAVAQFRIGCHDTGMAPAAENIYSALRELALVMPQAIDSDGQLFDELASDPELFKIILTGRPRESFPPSVWNSSYFIFFDSLSGQE